MGNYGASRLADFDRDGDLDFTMARPASLGPSRVYWFEYQGPSMDDAPAGDRHRFPFTGLADFDRLRARVVATRDRGIYVGVMLFGGSYECRGGWRGNPFNVQNNINGANGDPAGDGEGTESHILETPAITRLQEACLGARRQSRRRQERHDQRHVHHIHSVMASITLLSSNR